MGRQTYTSIILTFILMFLLIFDSESAILGARDGIDLCIRSVIPSLFPFITLSAILTQSVSAFKFPLLQTMFRIPSGSEGILLSGFLGGYPIGAQCVSTAFQRGQISKKCTSYLLSFCNQAGPSFIFGILAPQFPSPYYAWFLWAILIVSAILVARSQVYIPEQYTKMQPSENRLSFPDAVKKSVHAMAYICGWIIIFRTIMSLADKRILYPVPAWIKPALYGLLELSNGLLSLSKISDIHLRFVIASLLLSFGGVCVAMQTASVSQGISQRSYWIGKLLQTFYSLLLSLSVICLMEKPFPFHAAITLFLWAIIFTLPYLLRKTQKTVENRSKVMYNDYNKRKKDATCCSEKKSSVPAPIVSTAQN